MQKKGGKIEEQEGQGVFSETVFPSNTRSCASKVSPIRVSKGEMNKDDTNESARLKSPQDLNPTQRAIGN